MATIGGLLAAGTDRLRKSGSESARLDAELLLGWAIGAERTFVLAHPEAPVDGDAAARYEEGLIRREKGEPVAYIRGLKEFYGLAFAVDRRALIPRPETEMLVEQAEREIAWRLTSEPRPEGTLRLRVVDVGTGSGAIAIALARLLAKRGMLSEVSLLAVDCSAEALDLAKENAVAHAVADTIAFVECDLLPDASSSWGEPFDVVLANLPYIPSAEIDRLPVAASFEPRGALDGGPDGLTVIRRLLAALPMRLADNGTALLEIGADQAEAAEAEARALAGGALAFGARYRVEPDLAGHPRLLVVERWRAGDLPS